MMVTNIHLDKITNKVYNALNGKVYLSKFFQILICLIFLGGFYNNIIAQSSFFDYSSINSITITKNTGEKPQSKVWFYAGKWWAVLPNSSGTFVWRLDNNSWTQVLSILSNSDTQADCLVNGDTTHIFLYRGDSNNRLFSIEYDDSLGTYVPWSVYDLPVNINLDNGSETAVIDMDSNGIMWLASAGTTQIYVRWSRWPYTSWYNGSSNEDRAKINTSNVKDDDICDVTAFGGNKIGVLWSNQNDKRFYFRYHNDSDDDNNITHWSTEEIAAEGSAYNGVADDHINFAVNGSTIYAAIKTSYDHSDYTRMGLLRRLSNGQWDLFPVTTSSSDGTRPIALLNTSDGTIKVIYTHNASNPSDILYKEASLSDLNNFGTEQTLLSGEYNNVTSTKQNYSNEIVILTTDYSGNNDKAVGVIAYDSPLPVELTAFSGEVEGNNVLLKWHTETEINNFGFNIERANENKDWKTLGFVHGHGNSNIPHNYSFLDNKLAEGSNYKYRLKQIDNDGKYEYSNVINITIKPDKFSLLQNYPNPFNPSTTIGFKVPEKTNVRIVVYNSLGQQVAELLNQVEDAGYNEVHFNAQNLSSGVYVYTISTGKYFAVKKMSLLK